MTSDKLKKYISENILYNKKLNINKNTSIDKIYLLYQNYYQEKWKTIPLKVDDKYCLHINYHLLKPIINHFMILSKNVDQKNSKDEKFISSLKHEIYNNLLIEGYVSSKKMINDVINRKNVDNSDKMIQNVYNAMIYISQNRNINKDNLLYLYQTLTNDIDMNKEKLDGPYYRLADVNIANRDKGINSMLIDSYMNQLLNYLNDNQGLNQEEKIVKSIIVHFYFEFIHPYYDFNGRMGRLLVLWYAYNNDVYHYLAFFSRAIAAYREQYLKLFNITRFNQTLDITYFVADILYFLIKQKEHYLTLLKFDQYVVKQFNKKLSSIQKDIIMFDQAFRDIYQLDYYSTISLSKVLNQYKEYSNQLIYQEIKNLEKYKILKRVNKRNASYFIEYDLIN